MNFDTKQCSMDARKDSTPSYKMKPSRNLGVLASVETAVMIQIGKQRQAALIGILLVHSAGI